MQALIDFDGWRKWKDYATHDQAAVAEAKSSITTPPNGVEGVPGDKAREKKVKREKKTSLGAGDSLTVPVAVPAQ